MDPLVHPIRPVRLVHALPEREVEEQEKYSWLSIHSVAVLPYIFVVHFGCSSVSVAAVGSSVCSGVVESLLLLGISLPFRAQEERHSLCKTTDDMEHAEKRPSWSRGGQVEGVPRRSFHE